MVYIKVEILLDVKHFLNNETYLLLVIILSYELPLPTLISRSFCLLQFIPVFAPAKKKSLIKKFISCAVLHILNTLSSPVLLIMKNEKVSTCYIWNIADICYVFKFWSKNLVHKINFCLIHF